MMLAILFLVWLIGAVASNAAQREIGWANPNTYDDCFSGDYTLDLICIVVWPVFWPCWAVHKLVEKTTRRAIESDKLEADR
ncbi:hypothetical protein ACK9YZ_01155 [Rhizobium sp. ZK1]|uniref:hypothetical protein n=1 Tax=Rhizobium sp. ZK1 TaxID=3389872 RepID=UPI0039F64E0B